MSKYPTQEKLKERIQALFDNDCGCDTPGTAFLFISVRGTDGQNYGSYKRIHQSQLEGREISYGHESIVVLDTTFDPVTRKWERPL